MYASTERALNTFMSIEETEGSLVEAVKSGEMVEDKESAKVNLVRIGHESTIVDIIGAFNFCRSLKEYVTNGFNWPIGLLNAQSIEDFRKNLMLVEAKEQPSAEDIQNGHVPQELWWVMAGDSELIGMVKLQRMLTPALLQSGGHIACGLAPIYRGKGYGTAALKLALEKCQHYGLQEALVTTYVSNFASRRMIERVGGLAWSSSKGDDCQEHARYWVPCRHL